MKILRVLTRPNLGGPTRQAVNLWHALAAAGHQTILAVGQTAAGENSVDLGAAGIPELAWGSVNAAAAGWLRVPGMQRGFGGLGDLRAYRGLREVIRSFGPDVVHSHTSKAGLLGRMAARREQVPVIAHTFHGHVLRDYFLPTTAWVMRRVERALAARSDLLFAVSESCAAELGELGVAAAIRVIPPAVDTSLAAAGERQTARRHLGLPLDRPLLACVGRLVPIKRVDRFLALVAALPEVDGVVFGDGPLRAQLERQANPRVRFFGDCEDLPRWLAAFDALVIPSQREGLPLCGVEAAAAGVPAIGFDVPGVRDLIGACGSDLVVPLNRGIAGLAAAVVRVLAGPVQLRGAAELCAACAPSRVAAELARAYAAAMST